MEAQPLLQDVTSWVCYPLFESVHRPKLATVRKCDDTSAEFVIIENRERRPYCVMCLEVVTNKAVKQHVITEQSVLQSSCFSCYLLTSVCKHQAFLMATDVLAATCIFFHIKTPYPAMPSW